MQLKVGKENILHHRVDIVDLEVPNDEKAAHLLLFRQMIVEIMTDQLYQMGRFLGHNLIGGLALLFFWLFRFL